MKDTNIYIAVAIAATALIAIIYFNNSGMDDNSNVAGATASSASAASQTYTKPVIDVDAIGVDRLAGGELVIETLKEGEGATVEEGNTVEVHYSGVLTDGTPFDNSYDRGSAFSFQVGAGRVIQGWDKGLVGAKAGEQRLLLIPSDLAYGQNGAPGSVIGPDADLVFVVDVVSIQ